MDEEKLIQVSFKIPPSALDSLSRLAEQLRMLTETAAAQAAPVPRTAESERGESNSFDPTRFLELRQDADLPPQAVRADVSDMEDAKTVSAEVSRAGDAAAVSAEVQHELQNPWSAGELPYHHPEDAAAAEPVNDSRHTSLEERDFPLPPAETAQAGPPDAVPAVRAEAERTVPNAPEAGRDVERQVHDVESARTNAEERELVLAAVQDEVSGGTEAPLGAGVVVQTQPEMPQSRWSGVTEELVVPGPAPLTAEAVSLAFERDGRRYDNGFPLY